MIGQAVSENKMFEHCGQRRPMPEHGYPISSPCEPEGLGELIKWLFSKEMSPKDEDRIAKSADPDQSVPLRAVLLGLHCLIGPFCPNT